MKRVSPDSVSGNPIGRITRNFKAEIPGNADRLDAVEYGEEGIFPETIEMPGNGQYGDRHKKNSASRRLG